MSDVKLNGVSQPLKLAAAPSAQKTHGNSSADIKDGAKISAANPGAAEAVGVSSTEAGQERVEQAVTKLNDYVQSVQRNLQFNLDDSSGKTIITVVDKQTSEVVRQIPDDVALKLAQDLHQSEPLSLFKAKV